MDGKLRRLITDILHSGAAALETVVTRLHAVDDRLTAAERKIETIAEGTNRTTETLDEAQSVIHALDHSDQSIHAAHAQFVAFEGLMSEIARRVQVLSEIADQSNILAVNATLEAARAGERGKGFQVVADAMRALARQSATASLEIGDLLDDGTHRITQYRTEAEEASRKSSEAMVTARRSFSHLRENALHIQREAGEAVDLFREQLGSLQRLLTETKTRAEDHSGASSEILDAIADTAIQHVDPAEALTLIERAQVVDVRTPEEFRTDIGRIRRAINVPIGEDLPDGLRRLGRSKPILFVCRRGGRSARAARIALELGFEQVWNLKLGMEGWQAARLPMDEP